MVVEKIAEAPARKQCGPWWSEGVGDDCPEVGGGGRRVWSQSGRGPVGRRAAEAPNPKRRGPRWSKDSGGPCPKAAGAPVV